MVDHLPILADDAVSLLQLNGILIAALFGVIGVFFLIKKMKKSAQREFQTDFTLNDLRQLHADGHMTDEEYNAAKAKVAARALEKMKGPRSTPARAPDSNLPETRPVQDTPVTPVRDAPIRKR